MLGSPRRDESPIIIKDLMAQVGYFMLCWSQLEHALNNGIGQLRTELGKGAGPVQGSLQERLAEWTGLAGRSQADTHTHLVAEQLADEVKLLRGHRNLIVHGLLGGDARPNEGAPHISCAEGGYSKPTGEVRLYSLTHLEELTQSVDRCRIGFGMLNRWKPGPISEVEH